MQNTSILFRYWDGPDIRCQYHLWYRYTDNIEILIFSTSNDIDYLRQIWKDDKILIFINFMLTQTLTHNIFIYSDLVQVQTFIKINVSVSHKSHNINIILDRFIVLNVGFRSITTCLCLFSVRISTSGEPHIALRDGSLTFEHIYRFSTFYNTT